MKFRLLSTAALAAAFVMSAGAAGAADGAGGAAAKVGPQYGAWGFDLAGRGDKANPGDDFYAYADGGWDAATPIPADKTRFGMFDTLYDRTQEQLKAIIDDASAGKVKGQIGGQIGALYNSFMDEARIEKLDAAPLAADLRGIRAVKTKSDMAALMGDREGFGKSLFGNGVTADPKHPNQNVLVMLQGGLGLPDRDYYLKDSFAEKKTKYQAYVAQMLTQAGWENPTENAKAIVEFETKVAEASWSRIESRDADKTYNPMATADLDKYAPGFDWKAYFKAAGVGQVKNVIVFQNTAMPKLAKVFADTPLETLKAWEAFHTVDQAAPYLSKRFVDARFEFRNKALTGQAENRPRWKRGVSVVDGTMGEALGQEYVTRYFPPESKAKMDELVGNIKTAMKGRIEKLEWMGPETKTKALDKLSKFGVKIGYPVKWRDYSALKIQADDLYGNVQRSAKFERAFNLSKLGKPVDKDEWGMTPQTINAYYNRTRNEIVFPAAILQAPFFDPKADMAVNYGGIGGVIGHEISHGFDDQGRKADGDGVLTDWWTAEDAAKFQKQADRLGAQYDSYEVAPGAHVQGKLTMGENIGDLGGINLGLDAYHASLHGQPAPVLDGLTGDQRVFLGWAQVWREKYRPDAIKQQVVSDPHSPATFRVNGPMRNVDAWYDAFGIKPGDKLYLKPEDRVRIW